MLKAKCQLLIANCSRLGLRVHGHVGAADVIGSEDRNERCWCRCFLYIRTAFRLFTLYETHHANHFETKFAGSFDGLDR